MTPSSNLGEGAKEIEMIMRAYIDVDEVCAMLMPTWLRMYNSDWNDNLQPHQIKSWEIHEYVKTECGNKIYDYLEDPYLYTHVIPVDGAVSGVGYLRTQGFEIVFATSCIYGNGEQKYKWLCRHGFTKQARHPKDFVSITDKSLLDSFNAMMIDDNYEYIKNFSGNALLFTMPHNEEVEYRNRLNKWSDIYSMRIKI